MFGMERVSPPSGMRAQDSAKLFPFGSTAANNTTPLLVARIDPSFLDVPSALISPAAPF